MPQVPGFSLVVPAYNAARFLGAALASVARQDVAVPELEVIVVDDASTDDTVPLAHRALEALPFASHLVTLGQRRGPGPATNAGIDRAAGT